MKKFFGKKVFIHSFLIMIVLGAILINGTKHAEVICKYEEISLTDCLDNVKGYETNNFRDFHVVENDPQLLLNFTKLEDEKGKVKSIIVELEHDIAMQTAQVYYGRDSADFSEEDSEIMGGKNSAIIETISQKSLQGFKFLRLDVNQDFSIKNIKIAYEYQLIYKNLVFKYIGVMLISIIFSILLALSCRVDSLISKVETSISIFFHTIWEKRQCVLRLFIIIALVFGVGLFISFVTKDGIELKSIYGLVIICSAVCILIVGTLYRDVIWKYLHIYYFILTMTIGTITILALPPSAGLSADDEIHYMRTANLSWGGSGLVSAADAAAAAVVYADVIQKGEIYNYQTRVEWCNYVDKLNYEQPVLTPIPASVYGGRSVGVYSIAYIPGSVGLILGRAIGLSFSSTFMLGKWMNLLCYSLIFSIAIKVIRRRGKILVAVIGLIPTSLYMAASYSYDWWIICFVVLGYALYISEINSEEKIGLKRFALIMVIMVVGMLPKAIYFPLIFPMMFIKKEKCDDIIKVRILTIVSILILIISFIQPLFAGGYNDSRGGEGINSLEQIKFILTAPLQYTDILLTFLKQYLSPDAAYGYMTYLLYYGQAEYFTICMLIIATVAILDNESNQSAMMFSALQRMVFLVSCFCAIVLAVTALYISFTAVGSDTIAGCQPRYILPVFFPFVFFASGINLQVSEEIKSKLFVMSTSVMSLIYLYGIYSLHVCKF